MMNREEDVLLRAVEVARILGLGRSKTYELIASGQVPTVRIGRSVRVPKGALMQQIRQMTQGAVQ